MIGTAGFTAVHFLHGHGGIAFAILDGLGVIATILICRKWPARDVVRGPAMRQITRGIFIFWFLTLFGYYLVPGYFDLWMAPMGGGALMGTGLYIRLRWR